MVVVCWSGYKLENYPFRVEQLFLILFADSENQNVTLKQFYNEPLLDFSVLCLIHIKFFLASVRLNFIRHTNVFDCMNFKKRLNYQYCMDQFLQFSQDVFFSASYVLLFLLFLSLLFRCKMFQLVYIIGRIVITFYRFQSMVEFSKN